MEDADKDAASDEDRQEALGGYLSKKNKYQAAHDKDVKSNEQPLKGALDKVLKGVSNG